MCRFAFRCVLFALACAALVISAQASAGEKPQSFATGSANPQVVTQLIDQEILAKLTEQKLTALGQSDDAMFLRRIYLDIHGTLPPTDKAIAFLDSKDPNKRSNLIQDLLAHHQYGENFGEIWYMLLVPLDTLSNRKIDTELMAGWLAKQFNANRGWDKIAYDMLAAKGNSWPESPEIIYLLNGIRVLKQEEAIDLISSTFLGANLKCAQCHQHPFAEWTQEDYWGLAAFYSKMVREGTVSNRRGLGEGVPRKVELPDRYVKMEPKFLAGESPKLDPESPYRPVFAAWATSPKNAFFARCMVNRMWAHFFGRGLINPLDDVRPDNDQCTHPELLQRLTDAFIASGFDLKFLIRAICESQAYQRTSKPEPGAKDSEQFYGRMSMRVLTPLQLSNALIDLSVYNSPSLKGKNGIREFLKSLTILGEEFDTREYERGIPPQLRLANSDTFEKGRQALAHYFVSSAKTPAQFVESAYLRILARRPTTEENQQMLAYIQNTKQAHENIVWVLMNSSEFNLVR